MMAANKFATILHRNTNKITLILIYAALEWILILLLLSNSLFSYLIIQFAHFFGLKPPCPCCTRRLHHIFDPHNNTTTHRHLIICEFHAKGLGFSSNHRKQGMCEGCFPGFSSSLARFRNDKEINHPKCCCCCCVVSLDDTLFSTYLLLPKTLSRDIFECAKKVNFITDDTSDYSELCVLDDEYISSELVENVTEMKEFEAAAAENENEVLDVGVKLKFMEACIEKDMSSQDLEFYLDCSGNKLIPIESFVIEDHVNVEDQSSLKSCEVQVEENDLDMNEETKFSLRESMETGEDENYLVFHRKDFHLVIKDEKDVQETDIAAGEMNLDIHTDLPDLDIIYEMQNQESYECTHLVCGTEESVDGSVRSELEVISDGVVTIKFLKSALRTKRKALEVLYAELEEERNASEVAANQTMAMINRLQEEKAAIQMEAIQYQRLMEELYEYDQQALLILNDLVVEREKEKQELEMELEVYRSVLKKSNLSVDINQEFANQDNSGFEECFLTDFKDERLSILEQLQILEEQLVALDNESGFVKKTFFPLLDEMGDENGNGFVDSNGVHNCSISELEMGNKKLVSVEEIDHM